LKKASKKEGNIRLKIGKSTFFLPNEQNSFAEEFKQTLEQENHPPVPPGTDLFSQITTMASLLF